MGEVYRARDSRLQRDVAIKVLRDAASPATMARLEQEARLAGSLNHPNIVTVFDIGSADGVPFVVLEFLEGTTLRDALPGIASRRAIDIAIQVARGLAAAHEKGIVHRDLKPENLFLVNRGPVKILDFGVGRYQPQNVADIETNALAHTQAGTVMGTVGYMSPEQVRGLPVDTRSDIFSFGIVLQEMLSGSNPFRRDTQPETLAAILNDEPKDLAALTPSVSPALARIVARCLQKQVDDRFQSAADLAFALESVPDGRVAPAEASTGASHRSLSSTLGLGLLGAAAIAVAATFWITGGLSKNEPPIFEQLSFRRGSVDAARFGPDGATIVYSAAFDGGGPTFYTARTGSPESSALGLPSGLLLGISPSGELALALGAKPVSGSERVAGTLARSPLAGGAPREVDTAVAWADWIADEGQLALVRQIPNRRQQLEFPAGRSIGQLDGLMTSLRVSRRGDRVAYFEYPQSSNLGSLVVADRDGTRHTLAQGLVWPMGLAWDHDDASIWFAAGDGSGTTTIHAITLTGKDRVVYRIPGYATLQDRSPDGRLLFTRDEWRVEAIARLRDGSVRDLSWLDVSNVADMTSDGSRIAIIDLGVAAGSKVVSYLRATDGSPAVRLSEGGVMALSPDGKRAIVRPRSDAGSQLQIVPTGPGEALPLKAGLPVDVSAVSWSLANQLIVTAGDRGQPARCHLVDLDSGDARPVTPVGTACGIGAISPDGRFVLATTTDGVASVYPIDGSAPQPLRGIQPGETPVRWSSDGTAFFAREVDGIPANLTRIRFSDGQRQHIAALGPEDPIGVTAIGSMVITPDASAYAFSYLRHTSTLFLTNRLQ